MLSLASFELYSGAVWCCCVSLRTPVCCLFLNWASSGSAPSLCFLWSEMNFLLTVYRLSFNCFFRTYELFRLIMLLANGLFGSLAVLSRFLVIWSIVRFLFAVPSLEWPCFFESWSSVMESRMWMAGYSTSAGRRLRSVACLLSLLTPVAIDWGFK